MMSQPIFTLSAWDGDNSILNAFPELETCVSITEASRVLFGIKTMGAFVRMNHREALLAFFDGNHSDMVAWSKHAWPSKGFYAAATHRKVYRTMIKAMGLPVSVRLTQDRDFTDICTGFEFLKSDKKRWKRFTMDILAALPLFPQGAHSKMIHDYMVEQMRNVNRAPRQRRTQETMPAKLDAPLPSLAVAANVPSGEHTIMVPCHDGDLRAIGNAQNHCVGQPQMGYANRVRRGEIHIVAIYRENLSDGICVEFDAASGEVLQAQGRHRRAMSIAESEIVQALANAIYANRQ